MNSLSFLLRLLVVALPLASCGAERGPQPVDTKQPTTTSKPPRPRPSAKVPIRVAQPTSLDLNTIQEIQALQSEVTAELEITVDVNGKASEVRLISVDPPDNATALKFGNLMVEAYRSGDYTIPPGESAPYVISMSVSSGDPARRSQRPR
jgi:hypothetical protein